tara:strand:- start:57 stop:683 length:627 start_codon:yes stop_codon:yes gene_type:complete
MSYSQLSDNARHIVAVFTLATSQEVQLGLDWYPSAFKISERIGKRAGISTYHAAGVITALSPRNKWEDNVRNAESLTKVYAAGGTVTDLTSVPCRTTHTNKAQAISILTSPNVSPQDLITGPKRHEFYNSIVHPEINDVCIDGHAYSVWLGDYLPASKAPAIGKKLRATIKQDYHDATSFINEELGEQYITSDIQAITWVTHKRIHNV